MTANDLSLLYRQHKDPVRVEPSGTLTFPSDVLITENGGQLLRKLSE